MLLMAVLLKVTLQVSKQPAGRWWRQSRLSLFVALRFGRCTVISFSWTIQVKNPNCLYMQ